jgi:hypothetical protein
VSDVFGDLREWGGALAVLERLREEGRLDDHQDGLARLIRFQNWQLQKAALECALEVSESRDLLIADTLNALASRETSLELRILAAEALGHLLSCYGSEESSPFDVHRAYETLAYMAGQCHPPVLAEALQEAVMRCRPALSGRAVPAYRPPGGSTGGQDGVDLGPQGEASAPGGSI